MRPASSGEVGRRVDVEGEARAGRRSTCGNAAAPGVDGGASGLAETRRDEPRRPHRDRVRSAVQGPRDRDARAPAWRRAAPRPPRRAAGQVGGDDRDERRVDDARPSPPRARRSRRGRASGQTLVAVDRLGADDGHPLDARLLHGSDHPLEQFAHQLGALVGARARRPGGSSDPASSAEPARGRPRRDPTARTYAHRVLDRPLERAALRGAEPAPRSPVVTYSPKVFIPLTKLCRDVCHYCTFAAPPRRGERAYLTRRRGARDRARRRRGRLHARRCSRSATSPSGATASRARSSPRSAARRRSSTSRACASSCSKRPACSRTRTPA